MRTLFVLVLSLLSVSLGANDSVTIYQLAGQRQCDADDGVAVERAADLLRAQGLKVRSAERRQLPLDIPRLCGAPTPAANVINLSATDWAAFTAKNPDAGGYGVWVFDDDPAEIYHYDGTLQCGYGEEIPLQGHAELLATKGIAVLSSRKGTDGLVHLAVCGASTGAINVFAIPAKDLPAALELGFRLLVTHGMTERTQRPPRRPTPNPAEARGAHPGKGTIPLLW